MPFITRIMNWLKSGYVYFLIALGVGNLLYFCFFYEKEYQEVSVRTEISCASPATVWYVYKEKFSQERHFSVKKVLLPNKEYKYSFDIASDKEIEYIGLYWQVDQKTRLSVKSYAHSVTGEWSYVSENRNILDYASTGSRMEERQKGMEIFGKSGSNWVMLNTPENLNKAREIRVRHSLPIWGNVGVLCLALVFLLNARAPKPITELGASKWSRPKMLKTIFSLWAFLMPFWIIISHTLMAIVVVLSFFFLFMEKRLQVFNKNFRSFSFFYVFYALILVSSIFVDDTETTMKIAVDYSYFLLLPIAFSYIHREALFKVFDFFEKGVLAYFVLLIIYVTTIYFKISPEESFHSFVEASVERFWHTSYLSMLLLLIFIKNMKNQKGDTILLFVFYTSALLFMYVVNARMPFIVGLLLLVVKGFLFFDLKRKKALWLSLALIGFIGFITFWAVENGTTQNILSRVTNTDARISLWKASLDQIGNNYLFGVGNESTQAAIAQGVDGNMGTKFRNYNAHNQFLETALGHGIISAIVLIAMFFDLFRRGGIYASCFVLTCLLLFMVESYLNRQAGMIIVTFWYCFFLTTDLKVKPG